MGTRARCHVLTLWRGAPTTAMFGLGGCNFGAPYILSPHDIEPILGRSYTRQSVRCADPGCSRIRPLVLYPIVFCQPKPGCNLEKTPVLNGLDNGPTTSNGARGGTKISC